MVTKPITSGPPDMAASQELGISTELWRHLMRATLKVVGVVVCRDSDTVLSNEVRNQLDMGYPDAIRWRVRRSVRAEEAPHQHEALPTWAPDAAPTQEYVGLAAERLISAAGA